MRPGFFVLNLVKQATGRYLIDGQEFPIRPYSVFLIRPGHYRTVEFQELTESYHIALSESFLKENVHPAIFEEFPFLLTDSHAATSVSPGMFAEFEHLYQQLAREYQAHSPFRPQLLGHLLAVLLLKFREYCWPEANLPPDGRSAAIVRHFQRALEQHYRAPSSDVARSAFRAQDYAEAQHLHPAYLAQVIKNSTGKPISAWIAEKTVAEAKARLRHTQFTIKELSHQLGFAEPAHFSNYFKKHTGLTPTQYRQQGQVES